MRLPENEARTSGNDALGLVFGVPGTRIDVRGIALRSSLQLVIARYKRGIIILTAVDN